MPVQVFAGMLSILKSECRKSQFSSENAGDAHCKESPDLYFQKLEIVKPFLELSTFISISLDVNLSAAFCCENRDVEVKKE